MIFYGLDEAALGPFLGPFCSALTCFRTQGDFSLCDLYEELSDSVSPEKGVKDRLWIHDSKKLYNRPVWQSVRNIAQLENGVLSFLAASDMKIPGNFARLVKALAPAEDFLAMESTPWFDNAENLEIPVFCPEGTAGHIEDRAVKLKDNLISRNIQVFPPCLRFVPAESFNRYISACGGKSGAVQRILGPLIQKASSGFLTVDRQGGRRYYSDWLRSVFPGEKMRVLEETARRSVYRVDAGGAAQPLTIEFLVKADARKLEAALASMISKYVRELAMVLFNRWWARRVPGIRPTAGYPQDARRFLDNLAAAGVLPENPDILKRRL